MRERRAFSLIEVVVVLGIIALLSAVAATALRNIQRESRDRAARLSLETVTGAQETYHLERGRWGVSSAAMEAFSGGELSVTGGLSTGPDVVSVEELDEEGALGLAVLDRNGNCLTLVIFPPTENRSEEIQRRPGTLCRGSEADRP